MNSFLVATISFGEMELSNSTFLFLIFLTIFTFLSVIISSLKLFQSALTKKK